MSTATNDEGELAPVPPIDHKNGRVLGFVLAGVMGLGAALSGLFTFVALAAPFTMGSNTEEYPQSIPAPDVASSPASYIGPAILLLVFGPMTIVLAKGCYASVRAALGKPPIEVITPGLGWMIALVFGGLSLLAVVFGAIQGEWNAVFRAVGVVPLFFAAPFLAKAFRKRKD
jgi:Flp pilus assembly pilin Flp